MRKTHWMLVFAVGLLASCVTEGGPEVTNREDQKTPVEQVQNSIKQRIEKMRYQYGKELLASMQAVIACKELAREPVIAALATADSRMRSNLLYVLGYVGGGESQRAIASYLKDQDEGVRYEAASALLQVGDWSGVPVLIDFMASPDRRLRYKAFQTLREKTSQDLGYDFNAPETQREEALGRWKAWWAERRREIIYGKN